MIDFLLRVSSAPASPVLVRFIVGYVFFMARLVVYLILGICLWMPACWAASQDAHTIVIKNHRFDPPQLTIPAGQKIKLTVDNQDPTAEEFESYELNREKMVAGGKQIIIYLEPLRPGSYKYSGDFNPKTAQGVIVAQ